MTPSNSLLIGTKGAAPCDPEPIRAIPGIDFFNWTARNVFARVNTSVAARLQRCQDQTFLASTLVS
jgi:hypothetical protein